MIMFKMKKTINLLLIIITSLSGFLCLVSCSENHDIEEKISSLQSQPIKLCLDEMRCRNKYGDTIVVDSVKPLYRMVVYVDSSACSPCTLDKMYVWNESIKKARRQGSMLKHVFIVAPKPEQIEDAYLSIESNGLDSPIYVDTAYAFRKANPHLPEERMYHSFLLDEKDSVVIVGNPIENPKIDSLINVIVFK